jgi:hypothetical protein
MAAKFNAIFSCGSPSTEHSFSTSAIIRQSTIRQDFGEEGFEIEEELSLRTAYKLSRV